LGRVKPGLSNRQNCVIPAKAGTQWIKNPPRKRNNAMVLSASRGVFSCWIPAFTRKGQAVVVKPLKRQQPRSAGMTG